MNRNNKSIDWVIMSLILLSFLVVAIYVSNNQRSVPEETKQEMSPVEIDEARLQILLISCKSCHGTNLEGVPGDGPSLQNVGSRYSKDELRDILKYGLNNGEMPGGQLEGGFAQEGDLEMMVEWFSQQK